MKNFFKPNAAMMVGMLGGSCILPLIFSYPASYIGAVVVIFGVANMFLLLMYGIGCIFSAE